MEKHKNFTLEENKKKLEEKDMREEKKQAEIRSICEKRRKLAE